MGRVDVDCETCQLASDIDGYQPVKCPYGKCSDIELRTPVEAIDGRIKELSGRLEDLDGRISDGSHEWSSHTNDTTRPERRDPRRSFLQSRWLWPTISAINSKAFNSSPVHVAAVLTIATNNAIRTSL